MIKEDIVRRLGETSACHKLSQKEIKGVVTELFNILTNAFLEHEEVQIRGFGRFRLKYLPPRAINHPASGKRISSYPKYVISFDPAKKTKRLLRVDENHQPAGG